MNVSEALAARRSTRVFLDKPVEHEIVRRALEKAALAPSGGNLQPWHAIVISGAPLAALKSDMRLASARPPGSETPEYAIYPANLPDPYRARRWANAEAMYASIGLARENKAGRLQQLTKLSCLQKLCLAPTNECLWSPYLCVVSNLTQLTSLSINNCTLISLGQLETLRQLKLLRELDLSHDSCSGGGGGAAGSSEARDLISQQPFNPTAINAMAAITSLTSIDLSR